MADYTDGQGWSKLDATSARHLAQVISMFHGRAASKRTEMLLYCFSQLQGNCPYFRTGFRTIAKACDTKPDVARRFLVFCDTEEIFKAVGKTQKGKTPKRTFFWLDPNDDSYCGGQTPHPVAKHKDKTPVIHDITFTLKSGRLCALVGVNGAGKSTLFKALMELIPFSGSITWNGQPFREARRQGLIGYARSQKKRP